MPGEKTAGVWRVTNSNFYIGRLAGDPIVLPPSEQLKEHFPELAVAFPDGATLLAVTVGSRNWKIYSINPASTSWLAHLGLDKAVFPTRRDALEHLKEALKGETGKSS